MHRVIKAKDNKLTWTESFPWEFDFDTTVAMVDSKEAVELTSDEFEERWTRTRNLEARLEDPVFKFGFLVVSSTVVFLFLEFFSLLILL